MASRSHKWRENSTPASIQNVKCRLLAWILVSVITVTWTPLVTCEVTQGTILGSTDSVSTQQNEGYREDGNASSPWPPDPTTIKTTTLAVVTKVPAARSNDVITTEKSNIENGASENDIITTEEPKGYDVMKSKTFQVTLGVCMSLCGLLLVLLVLMMIYTKYRGWKDRMNVAPTVRTGGQIGTDRQELVT